jgi:serine protease Do
VDEKTDLAVIRIEAERLHQISLGDSAAGEVGDEVFAVGNPFGLDGSISRGIISAKNRSNVLLRDVEYQGFLQTDAVINPGNSGGPLVNSRGEVIGINTAIATTTGFYDGIGFAIPSNRAAKIIPHLVRGEAVTRGYLGVSMRPIAGVEEQELARLGWSQPHGVIVLGVLADSPACRAGLRREDIMISYNGQLLTSSADLTQVIADTPPGSPRSSRRADKARNRFAEKTRSPRGQPGITSRKAARPVSFEPQ